MPPGYVLISWAAMLRWLHFVTMWIIEGAPILSGFVEGAKYLKSALPHKRKWVLQQVAAVVSSSLTVSLKKYFFIPWLSASTGALKQSLSGCEVQQCLWDHDTQWTCAEVSGVSSVSGGIQGLRIFGHFPNASIERAQAPIQWFFALGESPLCQAEKNKGYILGTAIQWQLPQGYMEGWRLLWICDEKSYLLFLLQGPSNWLSTRLSATFFRWDLDVLDLLPQHFQICFRSSHVIVPTLISWF